MAVSLVGRIVAMIPAGVEQRLCELGCTMRLIDHIYHRRLLNPIIGIT